MAISSCSGAVKAAQPCGLPGGNREAIKERWGEVKAGRLEASSHEPFYMKGVIPSVNRKFGCFRRKSGTEMSLARAARSAGNSLQTLGLSGGNKKTANKL